MGMVKHGKDDGKILETSEAAPVFTKFCASCSSPINYKAGDKIPTLCEKCKKERDENA